MSKLRVHCFSASIDAFGAGPEQSPENPLGDAHRKSASRCPQKGLGTPRSYRRTRKVCQIVGIVFPVLPVKGGDGDGLDRRRVQATDVDTESVRVGTRHIEGPTPAMPAEIVPGRARIECIKRKVFFATDESEGGSRHDEMQIPRSCAHRAIAFVSFDALGRLDLDCDGTAMTASCV